MFTYLNPAVRKTLIDQGKLVRVNADGQPLSVEAEAPSGQRSLNLLGPVPLPIMPDRAVRGIDARVIFAMGGGVHCITQQQPLV